MGSEYFHNNEPCTSVRKTNLTFIHLFTTFKCMIIWQLNKWLNFRSLFCYVFLLLRAIHKIYVVLSSCACMIFTHRFFFFFDFLFDYIYMLPKGLSSALSHLCNSNVYKLDGSYSSFQLFKTCSNFSKLYCLDWFWKGGGISMIIDIL